MAGRHPFIASGTEHRALLALAYLTFEVMRLFQGEVLNGVMYVLSTGCQWRYIPRDLPPRSTLRDYFQRWHDDGNIGKHPSLPVYGVSRADGPRGQPHRPRD